MTYYLRLIIFTLLSSLLLLAACDKAENYYGKLDAQPEIHQNYNAVYAIGDTLRITGRLNPENNLVITIGGVQAEIFDVMNFIDSNAFQPQVIDEVKMKITTEMGIGSDRSIAITSGGNTIEAPAIEIVEDASFGVLPNPLKAVQHATMSFTSTPLYCHSGTGSIYIWTNGNTVSHIRKDGTVTTVLTPDDLRDAQGAFAVAGFHSGAVDPQERYLYFSALTKDGSTDNNNNAIYRLCRYDLQTRELTTLNRTLYPNENNRRTLASAQPFEGSIGNVKVYQITRIFPDSQGNLYVFISNRAIARLDADGNFGYLLTNFFGASGAFVPQTYTEAGVSISDLNPASVASSLPGIALSEGVSFVTIDPEEGLLYGKYYVGNALRQYDLINRVLTHDFGSNSVNFSGLTTRYRPYISGSFGVLTGDDDTNLPGQFGCYPLPDERLLILYYQGIPTRNTYYAQYPAWGIVDYKEKRGYRYAPGKFQRGSYAMNSADRILNTDEDGMVYMTANSNTVIVKTQYQ